MKRSSLVTFALLACAALASAAFTTYDRIAGVVASAYAGVKAFVLDGIALVSSPASEPKSPMVLIVRAKAFVLRLAKRERPVVTSSWRMCPST